MENNEATPVEAWKSTQKVWYPNETSPWMYVVKYADSTGNVFGPPCEAHDPVTGKATGGKNLPHHSFYLAGISFGDDEVKGMLDTHYFNVERFEVAELPPCLQRSR